MIYRTDYHIHTLYSDGTGSPDEYISHAVKEGISELGFSDHLTLTDDQQEWSMDPDLLHKYCSEILSINNLSKDLKVLLGLEIDYLPGKEEEIMSIINSLPLDFVIGSVHYLGANPVDIGQDFYHNRDLESLFDDYFETIGVAASSGLFDIMGHIDLVRIFGFTPTSDQTIRYQKLAAELKQNNVAIELNTNGKNKPVSEFYPDPSYLHIFREEGVPVCVNSDAHSPGDVGQHFDEAYALLIKCGYKEMATFDKRVRKTRKIINQTGSIKYAQGGS